MVALTVMVLGVGGGAQADDRSDAAAEQAEAEQRRAELTSSLEGVSAELGQAYLDLQNAKTALSTAQTDLATAEADLAAKEREQQTITNQLAVAQSTLTTLEQEATGSQAATQQSTSSIGQLVVSTYQGENSLTSWTYVLCAPASALAHPSPTSEEWRELLYGQCSQEAKPGIPTVLVFS